MPSHFYKKFQFTKIFLSSLNSGDRQAEAEGERTHGWERDRDNEGLRAPQHREALWRWDSTERKSCVLLSIVARVGSWQLRSPRAFKYLKQNISNAFSHANLIIYVLWTFSLEKQA